jgi:hypothetical protein
MDNHSLFQNKSICDNFLNSFSSTTIDWKCYEVILTPEWLSILCEICSYSLFIISSLIYLILFKIIALNSTPEMKLYKWYILWHSFMVYIYEGCITFLRLEILFPYPMVSVNGIVKFFSLGPLNYYLGDMFFMVIICCFYTTSMLFVFRYLQLSNAFLLEYFKKWKFSIPGHGFVLCMVFGTVVAPLHWEYEPEEKLRETLQIYNIRLYEAVKDRLLFGISVSYTRCFKKIALFVIF